MAGIAIPIFQTLPVATLADATDPTIPEVIAFRTTVSTFQTATRPLVEVVNPQHGFAMAFPNNPPLGANQDARVAQLEELQEFALEWFNLYTHTYAAFTTLLVGGQAVPAVPAAPAPVPAPRPPKMKSPEIFMGKSTTEARHFMRQCQNYLAVQTMADPETRA